MKAIFTSFLALVGLAQAPGLNLPRRVPTPGEVAILRATTRAHPHDGALNLPTEYRTATPESVASLHQVQQKRLTDAEIIQQVRIPTLFELSQGNPGLVLSPKEAESLWAYKSSLGWSVISTTLRQGEDAAKELGYRIPVKGSTKGSTAEIIDTIVQVMERNPTTTTRRVWRGLGDIKGFSPEYIYDSNFQSTSLSAVAAREFSSGKVMEIEIPPGVPHYEYSGHELQIANGLPPEEGDWESEVLLPPGVILQRAPELDRVIAWRDIGQYFPQKDEQAAGSWFVERGRPKETNILGYRLVNYLVPPATMTK